MSRSCGASTVVPQLLGAVLALGCLDGCRSDETDSSRHGLSAEAMHANRTPSHVVGAPQALDESDAGQDGKSQRVGSDAGMAPAVALKDRERLGGDALATRNTDGVVFDAEWRWSDVPGPSNAPETSPEGLEVLRSGTRLRMRIETASAGRISIVFVGHGYPWPDGTELRARADRLGYVLVWPDAKRYRNVVTGTLRALFTDRRLDRGTLFTPRVTAGPAGSLLGQSTTRLVMNTPVGEIQLEQANIAAAGIGAALLCRFLVELVGVTPETPICAPDQLVLRANVISSPGGKLQFVVNQLGRKQDLPLAGIQVPPEGATFETSGVPTPTLGSVSRAQLSGMRSRASTAAAAPAKDAPQQGLLAVNRTLTLRALVVDGIPVAWLPAGSELTLPELKNGNYTIGWRDFFGTFVESPKTIFLPAKVTLGKLAESGS
jgi:hypothetical protein